MKSEEILERMQVGSCHSYLLVVTVVSLYLLVPSCECLLGELLAFDELCKPFLQISAVGSAEVNDAAEKAVASPLAAWANSFQIFSLFLCSEIKYSVFCV